MDNPAQEERNSTSPVNAGFGSTESIEQSQTGRETAADGLDTLGGKINEAASVLKTKAAEMVEPVKDHAVHVAEEQINAGAAKVDGVARAVHEAADRIEGEIPHAGAYVHQLADGLERASHAVRDRSLVDIMDAVDDFAHRQPLAFFGTTVLAGFALTRFLKTSGPSRSRGESRSAQGLSGGDPGSSTEYGAPEGGGMPS